ncbi:MAG: hypothetical protein OK436_07640, partial [Thaumarchaeota archaeon]|nr:hypothetical protein [Nitrososphaerota archaeon]
MTQSQVVVAALSQYLNGNQLVSSSVTLMTPSTPKVTGFKPSEPLFDLLSGDKVPPRVQLTDPTKLIVVR